MTGMLFSPRTVVIEVQGLSILVVRAVRGAFRRPFYFRDILIQMDHVGVQSMTIVMLTGFFTGAVLALQTSSTLATFGAVGLTGSLVSISLVRELGPVLAALMVAGRVGLGDGIGTGFDEGDRTDQRDESPGNRSDQETGCSPNFRHGDDAAAF